MIILILLIIAAVIGIAWYVRQRSKAQHAAVPPVSVPAAAPVAPPAQPAGPETPKLP